jgi:hypothetical protein
MKSLVALLVLLIASESMANNRAGFAARTHGEGLPTTIGTHPYAEAHRERYMSEQGIETFERHGLTWYRGNSKGLALVKNTNTDERAFQNIMRGTQSIQTWRNGSDFISRLEEYTRRHGCIPKITSVSHGWRTDPDIGEIHGLSGARGYNGIYSTEDNRPKGLKQLGTRTLDRHLREAVQQGKVRFCETCIAQFYACNISTEFANVFADVSGCQTVLTTGQASPYFQKMDTEENRRLTLSAFHYWLGSAALWEERGRVGWYRVTPRKDNRGRTFELIKENLGPLYIAL